MRARARPSAAGAGLWPMRTTAPASGAKARLTACGSRISPTCGARKAGSTCVPCAMRTRAECARRKVCHVCSVARAVRVWVVVLVLLGVVLVCSGCVGVLVVFGVFVGLCASC